MRLWILSALLICLSIISKAQSKQYNPLKEYDKDALREDFQLLRKQLEQIHTGLYEYISKEELDTYFDGLLNQIDHPMTAMEFYRLIVPLVAKIRNGHTAIFPSEDHLKYATANKSFFPFIVSLFGDDLVIARNYSRDTTIKQGDVIAEINGMTTDTIIQRLLMQETRDGFNLTHPLRFVERGFSRRFAWQFGYPENFDLLLKTSNDDERAISIKSLPLDTMIAIRNKRYGVPESRSPLFIKIDRKNKLAILTIRTFDRRTIRKSGFHYSEWLAAQFERIKKAGIEHLILDLRDNGGGNDGTGEKLFRYLTDQKFVYYQNVIAVNNHVEGKKYYKEKLFIPNLFIRFLLKKDNNQYVLRKYARQKPIKPRKNNFLGELYVLINGFSFSATGEFAGFLKDQKRAIFIGEEAGGNAVKNTSGFMLNLILPNTKTRVIVPVFQYVLNAKTEQFGRGVIPDYNIEPTPEEVFSRKDPVMDFALELIKSKKNN